MDDSPDTDLHSPWPVPAELPPLGPDEVHVWCAATNVDDRAANELLATLSSEEQERAARYILERSRRRFIACRAAQRMILAAYVYPELEAEGGRASEFWRIPLPERHGGRSLQTQGRELQFDYSPLGKPTLAPGCDAVGRLRFNVSNSGDMALVAIALDRELGVDVERIRDNLDHDGLAQRYFATEERDKLRRLSEADRLAGFFDCWTRKEAFLKAIGKGLTYPLDRAIVSVGPTEPCRLLSLDGDAPAAAAWSLLALHPAPGYVAAIALAGSEPKTSLFRWEWK